MTEFHVEYHDKQWGVLISNPNAGPPDRISYPAWDKRVALSYAKAEAKKNRPARVLVHDRKTGAIKSTLEFGDS